MYENTPWEHLSLWAPWLGAAAIVLALLLVFIARRRELDDPDNAFALAHAGWLLGTYALSVITIGILFTIMWRPAHDTYPHAFGRAAVGVSIGAMLVSGALALIYRPIAHFAFIYGSLTAAVCAAAALSAFSTSIIAEGQVTAMVLPVGYAVAALFAAAIAIPFYRHEQRYEAALVIAFVVLAYFASDKLPVVQFRDDGSMFAPVTGGVFIVVLGRLARARALPMLGIAIVSAAALATGYLLQWWYGVALAAVGLSISGGWGLLHQPSEEYPLPHSTPS